ncbi:minor tail protein [Microbacterium phage AvGardian]|uniref:minor tail protein n=1 Tax=Microbacterium phage AvGardian TaxID=2725619 RepID=UPI001464A1B0|nr:minor tail protein [Microbacterium phage AvGardian]QJD49833.1 minor tail protein [Microbacterium phage AvGardian]
MSEMSDFTVEVRDRNFVRQGQIAPEYTDLKFVDVHNGVGSWELKLPDEHPLLPALKAKGSGIVVTEHWMEGAVHKYRTFSGRMRTAVLSQSAEDPAGTWVISGVDDNIVAAATRVYPDPAHAADAQASAYWELSGAAETVMKNAVLLNAGSGAIVARRYPWLTVPASTNLGGQVKCSSRFDVLGDLLTSLGTAGGLGWEFRQVGAGVTFSVYVPQNKTGEIRLDIRNGGISSNELGFTAPSASEVLVLGQGQGEQRTVLRVASAAATAEATAWGLRWEQVKDQRNTDDPVELQQAGDEILAEQGATVNSLKVVPSDSPGMRLGRDWYRGDRITVVVDGQETTAVVTQVAVSISSAGVIRQATVGDPVGFSFEAKIASKVKDVEQRVGQVERLIGQGVDWADVSNVPAWISVGDRANSGRGTTAQRDAYFGATGTVALQVALANRRPTWFNTTTGLEEQYYAPTGSAGLTAPGLLAGFPAGWYPVPGSAIFAHRGKTNGFSAAPAAYTETLLAASQVRRGGMTDTGNSGLVVPVGGFYRHDVKQYFSAGGAQAYVIGVSQLAGSTLTDARVNYTNADTTVFVSAVAAAQAGQAFTMGTMTAVSSNTYGTTGYNGSYHEVAYVGPPLVNG